MFIDHRDDTDDSYTSISQYCTEHLFALFFSVFLLSIARVGISFFCKGPDSEYFGLRRP